jgi:hypothetical protein
MRFSQISGVIVSACIVTVTIPQAAAAPVPGPAAAAPTVAPAAPGDEDAEAKQLFNARKYPEAAQAFEQLFARTQSPKHLFNAAMARELAGHEGHAYMLLRRYLTLQGLAPNEEARAKDRVDALQRRTVPVRLVIVPESLPADKLQVTIERTASGHVSDAGRAPLVMGPDLLAQFAVQGLPGQYDLFLEQGPWVFSAAAEGYEPGKQDAAFQAGQAQVAVALTPLAPPTAQVTANFAPQTAVDAGIDITLTHEGEPPHTEQVRSPAIAWELAPGAYRLAASARGFKKVEQQFTVDRDPVALDLRFEPEPVPEPKPKPSKSDPWLVGQAVGGGVLLVGGIAVLAVGSGNWRTTLDSYDAYAGKNVQNWDIAADNLFKSWKTYGAGAGLLGAGFGVGMGAVLTHYERKLSKPKTVWAIETGIGAGLAILGGILIGRAGSNLSATQDGHARNFDNLESGVRGDFAGMQHGVGGGSALLGFGTGLALSGVLGLIRTGRPKKTTVAPTGAGLVISGRF